MENYQEKLLKEQEYLKRTLNSIKNQLAQGKEILDDKNRKLISAQKEMWENSANSPHDYGKIAEMGQYLTEVYIQSANYQTLEKRFQIYEKMLSCPYFGRFDFWEKGSLNTEKIYIGLNNVIDQDTRGILVYDWRAPISSIFYRYELGDASYQAPMGTIHGQVLNKRQYKIQNAQLKYFFDCSIQINDEILQEVLSRNTSPQMRNIVETIQKEQDKIIRDTENQLLIVQGIAGSGKTSVALHRIAYLLYQGLNSELKSHNIIIISPNDVFINYISHVLPELGEENVQQVTFDDFSADFLGKRFQPEAKTTQLEFLVASQKSDLCKIRQKSIEIKGSESFIIILDRLIDHYEHKLINFRDVYYHGEIIAAKQQLRNTFLNDKSGLPAAKKLGKLEYRLLEKIHPLQKIRRKELEKFVQTLEGHDLEIKPLSRLISMKESSALMKSIRKFTEIDFFEVYQTLFLENGLMQKLSKDLNLPQGLEKVIALTRDSLNQGIIYFEDCAPLLYLKIRLEGNHTFSHIKHVVVDEAQDYTPIQYQVLHLLFQETNFTVLGDINQSLGKTLTLSIYKDIEKALNKNSSVKLHLNKGFRSSFEISAFAQKIIHSGKSSTHYFFHRHETEPIIVSFKNREEMDLSIVSDAEKLLNEGYQSIGVICKSAVHAQEVFKRLKYSVKKTLVNSTEGRIEKGIVIIPSYLAKGLEFDAVLVYDVSKENYSSRLDRKLLYISCTRALHRLTLYYTGEKSPILWDE